MQWTGVSADPGLLDSGVEEGGVQLRREPDSCPSLCPIRKTHSARASTPRQA